jgi:hypothetical protein
VNFPILFRQPFDRLVHERHCPRGIKNLGSERTNWFCEESSTLLDRVVSTPPALAAGELWCTFTCDLRTKVKYRIGLVLKEKPAARMFSFGYAILAIAGWRIRSQRKNRLDRYLAAAAIILLNPLLSVAVLQKIRTFSRVYIRHCAYCGVGSV